MRHAYERKGEGAGSTGVLKAREGAPEGMGRFHQLPEIRFAASCEHNPARLIAQVQHRCEVLSSRHDWVADGDAERSPPRKPWDFKRMRVVVLCGLKIRKQPHAARAIEA